MPAAASQSRNTWKRSLARYLTWIAACAFILFDVFLAREAVQNALTGYGIRALDALPEKTEAAVAAISSRLAAFDRWSLLLLAAVGVSLAVMIEQYFRRGETSGELIQRVKIVFSGLAAAALLTWIIGQLV